ncbi:MAG: VWA domain-containing protein [Candidatus Sulfotelmatobacter sp.]
MKAPTAARREYEKGARFLIQKNFSSAVECLTKAVSIYPNFVSAHNALGSAYLNLGQNDKAQTEFSVAVGLDSHLPYSYLNLGRAELALQNFPAAEESIQKASERAPLDLHLLVALTYAQLMNHDYSAVIATAQQVHSRKHNDAAIVHYFAAAAWQGQNNLPETEDELQVFLGEAPTSSAADAARAMIKQIEDLRNQPPPPPAVEVAYSASPLDPNVTSNGIPSAAQRVLEQMKEQEQLAEVESEPEGACESCSTNSLPRTPSSGVRRSSVNIAPYTLRSTVNEVAVFFAATDHGQSVSDLTQKDVVVRDAGNFPANVLGFRNESELPLRLGLVIDTSTSITHQFAFEQKAAASFLRKSLTGKKDLAFVVGFSNAVLLVQDFTSDGAKISQGIDQLAPAGGTALWDAVQFASDKLGNVAERQPVAKILVVISDGEDNSSSATLKEAIESAERQEVIVYTVSTRELVGGDSPVTSTADGAMRVLAARTGGAAFFPNSLGNLDRRLSDLQQVLRSRYLISYKPAQFRADGSYRTIEVTARKSGHKLRVYARRGYYSPNGSGEARTGQSKASSVAR